jgi:hypothetical protein
MEDTLMSKQRIILEGWRKFLNENKEFEGKLEKHPGYHTEKDNQHLTATYRGFAICKDNGGPITRMKGKKGEHERGFRRGSGLGTGRYDFDEWQALKADVAKRGIQEPVLIVAEWKGDDIIARVYEGNHRIRLGCQTDQPIPVEIKFFGKSEEHIEEDYFDRDLWFLITYGLQ